MEDDPYFKRDGEDVHVELPVSVAQAMLGASLDVLTLDGMVELKVGREHEAPGRHREGGPPLHLLLLTTAGWLVGGWL